MQRPEEPRFGPNGNASDEEIYDRVVVARATVGGSPDQLMALVVVHPRDDVPHGERAGGRGNRELDFALKAALGIATNCFPLRKG